MDIAGKAIVITGAGKGLGQGMAAMLAQRGAGPVWIRAEGRLGAGMTLERKVSCELREFCLAIAHLMVT